MTNSGATLPENVRGVVESPARLDVLKRLGVLDTGPDADFERIASLTARLFNAPIALISLVDRERQWFRANYGDLGVSQTGSNVSLCAHTISLPEPNGVLVVPDTMEDGRFRSNPLVVDQPGIRFYAGAPIIVSGEKIGSLCVIDTSPRGNLPSDLESELRDAAALASALFTLKEEARVRARTAAALMREEWRHALTLEAGKVGSWIWDLRSGEITCNDTFRRMYGLPDTGPIKADQIFAATNSLDRATVDEAIRASLDQGVDYQAEARIASTGAWLTMRGRVYQRDALGNPLIMMGASIDITDSKNNEAQTRVLLRELNHRVKNTLAMIQSIARQTIRRNPDPQTFIAAFSGRLRTISDVHILLADRDWLSVQLYEVISSQFGANFLSAPDRAEVKGEDVALPPDHALGLGLILHELTTNAHRYGAWSDASGTVCIEWTIEQAPVRGLRLNWREKGGPLVRKPEELGLGVRLIERSLAKVLDSQVELEFAPDGVKAQIYMPLP